MTIAEQFVEAFKDIAKGKILTNAEIRKIVLQKHNVTDGSILPTAYCYNRWSVGVPVKDRLCLFEYVEKDKFRYLGEGYNYTGKVYREVKKTGELIEVGEWNNGMETMYVNSKWEPSLKEYDPKISVEQWQELWHNPEVFDESSKKLMEQMMVLYGQATCAQLAEKFLGDSSLFRTYNSAFMYLGRKVHKELNCPLLVRENEDGKHFWSVACFYRKVNKKIDDVKGQYIFKLRDELVEALQQEGLQFGGANVDIPVSGGSVMPKHPKNLILYGPPGTGKTYNTVNYAVAIIEGKTVEEIAKADRKEVLAKYNEFKNKGQIEFCTFHQSFGYEEFIEGIKPKTDDSGNVVYDVVPGCFREFCEKQLTDKSIGLKENPTVWKIVLSKTSKNDIKTECLEKNHIRIGYGDEKTYEELINENDNGVIKDFVENMSVGDIVVVHCYPNSYEAIGIITSDFRKDDNYNTFKQVRDVRWILNDGNIRPVDAVCTRFDTRATVARVGTANLNSILKIVEEFGDFPKDGNNDVERNRVFIIDEINRGNISKIFGELITLIEDTKRIGADEEMRARLPYSGEKFGVPNNVYLLGTMNTADRSIALIDTALRRRFKFVEMQPNAELLKGIEVEGVKIKELLEMINKRIEVLYDREHTIGHSFFMGLNNASTIADLAEVFECNVIPLLKEYFYNDFERIAAVLGDDLNKNDATVNFILRENDYVKIPNSEIEVPPAYKFNFSALTNPEAYKKIYE